MKKTDFEGYKVMDIADSKRAIIINSASNLTLSNVELTCLDTAITVEKGNDWARSFIVVLLNDIKGALYVYDQEGKELDGFGYYEWWLTPWWYFLPTENYVHWYPLTVE